MRQLVSRQNVYYNGVDHKSTAAVQEATGCRGLGGMNAGGGGLVLMVEALMLNLLSIPCAAVWRLTATAVMAAHQSCGHHSMCVQATQQDCCC